MKVKGHQQKYNCVELSDGYNHTKVDCDRYNSLRGKSVVKLADTSGRPENGNAEHRSLHRLTFFFSRVKNWYIVVSLASFFETVITTWNQSAISLPSNVEPAWWSLCLSVSLSPKHRTHFTVNRLLLIIIIRLCTLHTGWNDFRKVNDGHRPTAVNHGCHCVLLFV